MNNERIILIDESNVPESEQHGALIIHKFPFRIGRQKTSEESPPRFGLKENDIYLEEPRKPFQASRNHLEIGFSGGSAYVRDLGSVNGTIVNGMRMHGKGRGDQSTLLLQKRDNLIQLGKPSSPWIFQVKIPVDEKRYRMVIADDDPNMQMVLQGVFEEEYDIIVAEDGERALEACLSEEPDIAILDWEMPKLKGVEVCKKLKCNLRTSNLPIIMLTGRAEVIDRITGIEVGADDYITKPPDLAELQTRVNGELARSLHARDICWLTGIPSEMAFRDEVNKLLASATTKKEFELIKITLTNLGIMEEKLGFRVTDEMLRRIAETVWGETVKTERTVAGQLQIGQWGIFTPSKSLRKVKKSVKANLNLVIKNTPLRFSIQSCSSARCSNYYGFIGVF